MGLRDAFVSRWRFAKAWVRDGTPLWQWLAVAIVLFALPYLFPATYFGVAAELPDRVRWSGMLFQFAGLTTVVWGLNTSRQLFDRSSLWNAVGQWLGRARHIVRPPKPVSASAAMSTGAAVVLGTAEARAITSGGSLEDRVTTLENDVKRVEGKLPVIEQDVRKLRSEMNERIGRESIEREAYDRKISSRLETATIGGIHLEVAGLAYLFVGIDFATLPLETACLLRSVGL